MDSSKGMKCLLTIRAYQHNKEDSAGIKMKRSRSKQRIILTRSVEPSLHTIIEADQILEHETEDAESDLKYNTSYSNPKRSKSDLCLSTRILAPIEKRTYRSEEEETKPNSKQIEDIMDSIAELSKLLEMHRTISRLLDDLKSKPEEARSEYR
mmetsp:Transcript_10222/g.30195  ORF Transcript_10222/g.30195 Transcript_10222/m.30195 type:complete len:153 (-) Transcript_10222:115-573(-)